MRIFSSFVIAILCFTLCTVPVGCTVSQAKINTAITDIGNWTPVVASDATALLSDIASFEPADAAQIQSFVTTMNADATALEVVCKQYLAAPSSTLLAQISALVGTLATSDSQALLAVLQVKNPNSQLLAKGILTTIATAVTILSGYLSTIDVTPASTTAAALEQLGPLVDRGALAQELAHAQRQGLAPAGLTLAQAGF